MSEFLYVLLILFLGVSSFIMVFHVISLIYAVVKLIIEEVGK